MNYTQCDPLGMYRIHADASAGPALRHGQGPALMGAQTLIGNDVYNTKDEDIGDIEEIVLDMRTGRVAYAVLSLGGFLGRGETFFAVPWSALLLDRTNKRFVLDVEHARLRQAPGFEKERWPDMADPTWAGEVHAYYGATVPVG